MHAADDKVVAEEGVQGPERRVLHRHAFNQHAVATVEVHELGTHSVLNGHLTFVDGFTRLTPGKQFGTTAAILTYHALFPAIFLGTAHGPPSLHGTLSVDDPFTGNGQVGLAVGIDKGVHVVAIDTFPAGKDGRRVKFGVGVEFQDGTFFEMEVDIAFERNGAGVESPGRNNHGTTAGLVTSDDG